MFATSANSEELSPSRSAIESTASKMQELSSKNDWPSWVGLFAEDSAFTNPIVSEPIIGRDAILKMAMEWPQIENVEQWRVIEGSRMVIGYRERGILEGGRTTSSVGDNSMLNDGKVLAEVEPLEFAPYAFLKWEWNKQ